MVSEFNNLKKEKRESLIRIWLFRDVNISECRNLFQQHSTTLNVMQNGETCSINTYYLNNLANCYNIRDILEHGIIKK